MGSVHALAFLMVAVGSAAADPAPPATPASTAASRSPLPRASALQLVGIPSAPPPSLAAVGAMLTGATLDSATADADRDAEAKRH